MKLRLLPVTDENRSQVLRLRVAEGQETYIETVEECLEEADALACWRPVGICDGETLVGFAMYCRWKDSREDRVWMDRLLIDGKFQGKGYGKGALKLLLERLKEEYGAEKIYLSVYPDNLGAVRLYEQFGFRFNGELDTHGEHVMALECH